MHVILTHEQADFDAIAAMLASSLLYESAIPVLPKRLNHNVRSFLTIYGMDFPMVFQQDLPERHIDLVTMVDTQSVVSIKGMSKKTRFHIIDHHKQKENLPADWKITCEQIGSVTSLLVEELQEIGMHLSILQASLLMLGIYEDTGSLTYPGTTARDLQAASYLLTQGANLNVVSEYLSHPLSPEQKRMYEEITTGMENYSILGNTVVVSCIDAGDLDEEISTLAHRARDQYEPDGLVLLVKTSRGVQLVARSSSDRINVAEIAAYFGGGGHARAAAALIQGKSLTQVHEMLLSVLNRFVMPPVTVGEIMSQGLQVLPPDTPVQDAARRMQKYGYEGYPVVNGDEILGLLTRRAVDRAQMHKLNMNVGSLMKAGDVSISPDDPVEKLQELMTSSGWGQIPVKNPSDGHILGIVTRTDLLKTLTPQASIPGRQNLASKLETTLPSFRLALLKAVVQVANEQRIALYIVGGFVRDLLLGRPCLDFDLVVEGDAIGLTNKLAKKYGGRVVSHTRFGTAKWQIAGLHGELVNQLSKEGFFNNQRTKQDNDNPELDLPESLDLTSARIEFYTHPSALPTVERGSIKLDLHRRDFTINTLAIRLDGRHYGDLYDYWGGLNDLMQGFVRVLHSLSFVDDPTRMLRAVRFVGRFNFQISNRTQELLKEARPLLDRVSGDRIRHELDAILVEDHASSMISQLDQLGLLKAIHPDLVWDSWLDERIREARSSEIGRWRDLSQEMGNGTFRRISTYILWLIRLDESRIRQVVKRLKTPKSLRELILSSRRLLLEVEDLTGVKPSQVTRRISDIPELAVVTVYHACEDASQRELLLNYLTKWKEVKPVTTGDGLRRLGLPPGPIYRTILDTVRAAWLDGEIQSASEEVELVKTLVIKTGIPWRPDVI